MAILLIAWLAAALVLVAIDLRARLTGQPRGREGTIIWLFALGLAAFSAFWLTR